MPTQSTQNLATAGQESFKLKGQEEAKNRVVINIQEDKTGGIVLDKKQYAEVELTGNFFVDLGRKINHWLLTHSKIKLEAKANFFHLLSVMIDAGIPMVKALRSLVAQNDSNPRLQLILNGIAGDVEAGESLSGSMLNYPDVFIEQEIGMIESGEASGQLVKVLENLAKDTEKAHSIRSKVKSAMIYPLVIFFLLIAVVVAMMVFVIPKLKDLFANSGAELPMITKVVVGISDFMVNQKLILIAAVIVIVAAFMIIKKTDFGKYALDKFTISVPIFGRLFKLALLSRFARSLSNLIDSDLSIIKTMEITANSMGNEVYRKRLLLAMEDIKQGIPLAENLTDTNLFPPMLVSMIDIGEKTAQLDKITAKVADFYEDEVDTAVSGISKIIEPVMLISIGVVVGTVVAAIMLPIMKLTNVSGGL